MIENIQHDYFYMGRKKLNRTAEELREQWRKRRSRFYERNKERLNAERLERYYKSKGKTKSIQ
jgi:hypothetical protein